MSRPDIAVHRLYNQQLARPKFDSPGDVVAWLGAVQAQEYAGAKWALGLRLPGAADAAIEQAFTDGMILRTHLMRPTWHFVTPADIRWMLALTAPRVHAANAYYYRQFELDANLFRRSNAVLAGALQDGKQLTRRELQSVLAQAGISAEGPRLSYLMMYAELEGIICSGARRGKQFTYALLAERAPQARVLEPEEALAELTRRYFTSHGPAMVQDFAWWSGLTIADAKAGLEMAKAHLVQEIVNGKTCWYSPSNPTVNHKTPAALLLPAYDEYTVAYKDHSAILDPQDARKAKAAILDRVTVIAGQVAGNWRRTFSKGIAVIESAPFRPFTPAESEAFAAAAQRYGTFLEMPVELL